VLWIGEGDMAQVIEFYIPAGFRAKARWVPAEVRGKIIQFPTMAMKRSA
jgi:hypothetical protein